MRPSESRVRPITWIDGLWILCYASLAAWLTWRAGQDVNWDLRNYHFYTPFELFGGRFERDVDVAGVQSYMNPLFDLPFFIALQILHLKPVVVGVGLGAFQGIGLWLVHRLVLAVLTPTTGFWPTLAAVSAGITAAFGAGFHAELGVTMGDATMAVFVLAAVVVVLSGIGTDGTPSRGSMTWAGLFLGVALGGKLVAAMYIVGLVAVLTFSGPLIVRLRRLVRFGAFAVIGYGVTSGYWLWLMFRHFKNPLFPYLQGIAERPLGAVDTHFLPKSIWRVLFLPYYIAFHPRPFFLSEQAFRDARILAAFVVLIAFGLIAVVRWRRHNPPAFNRRVMVLGVFFAVSFAVWEYEVSTYRYAIPLEMIGSAIVVVALAGILRSVKWSTVCVIPLFVAMCVSAVPPGLGRIPWSQTTYFDIDASSLDDYKDSTIMLWEMPNGYLIPHFPASTTFVRIHTNWSPDVRVPWLKTKKEMRLQAADRNRTYLLEINPTADAEMKENALEWLGLTLDSTRCRFFSTVVDTVRICRARFLDKPY